jgi:hypothetical protein
LQDLGLEAGVRFFYPNMKEDKDYESLYFLQPGLAGPAGNSRLSTCIESHNLPFIIWHGSMLEKFTDQFFYFLEKHFKKDSPLYEYFRLGLTLSDAKRMAVLSRDPVVISQWQSVRKELILHHNYYDALPAIVKALLTKAKEDREQKADYLFRVAFLKSAPLRILIENKLIPLCDVFHNLGCIELFCEPLIHALLLKREISVDQCYLINDINPLYEILKEHAYDLDAALADIKIELEKLTKKNRLGF